MHRKIAFLTMGILVGNIPTAFADPLVDPFRACGKIANNTDRLSCFDQALQTLDQRQAVVQESSREQAEADYGLKKFETSASKATEKEDTRAAAPVSVDGLKSKIVEVFVQNVTGRHMIVLENGQLWRETSVSSFRGTVRPGMEATISEGAIGGYRMKFDGKSGFLGVTRVK
ncbi:hypothetical protein [Sphingosinicella microcystinivorans]|uniref:Uncharacterized protein n=1 Tax=Sphingosinicella microcystinivorans TaxID=335406 RepID=A0AAD1D8E9_SPHMI|nr:hypothetical protein [Sphingosinicella microcystinivorans]RKS87925.1 hypothetical protein DFR51_2571 [Sphingosinicella microcystinivorans]BBE35736.1 hypothetical protein SmB9_33940 [Sphingosinicella microcystinivorans]